MIQMKYLIYGALTALVSLAAQSVPHAQELNFHGFVEGAYGSRIENNDLLGDDEYTLGETRMQMRMSHFGESAEFFGSVDFLNDLQEDKIETEVREAYLKFSLGSKTDVKIGRQVITWGTGDLVFINDVFPKDYISFFVGREDQYLKLPNDAIRLRLFTGLFNADIVGIPFFQPNQLPYGQRLSYYNPLGGGTVGMMNLSAPTKPDKSLDNGEVAVRLYRYAGNYQVSGYLYRGFYKDPMGMDMNNGVLYYPELNVYGSSLRGPVLSGIVSAEYGFYNSREEDGGDNPHIPNNQHRFLAGYERQWWTDFTMGLQYYGEYMADFTAYENTLPQSAPAMDEFRHLLTARLTQMLKYQTVNLSLFTFYSPTDEDWHLRPSVTYKYSDEVALTLGGNFFDGEYNHTLFGQFENNNNIFARCRYSF